MVLFLNEVDLMVDIDAKCIFSMLKDKKSYFKVIADKFLVVLGRQKNVVGI